MHRPQGTTRRLLATLLAALAVCALAASVTVYLTARDSPRQSSRFTGTDLRGTPVTVDPGPQPAPLAKSQAVADAGGRLVVPAVHLDVPLGALNEVDGAITPPGFTSAYWVRNRGVPLTRPRTGTVYVVMHAVKPGGLAPGNYLTDVARGTSTVKPGESVIVDNVRYTITGSRLIPKGQLAQAADVWADTPTRLMLITCLEHADGTPSTDNVVVTARLA